MPLPMPAAALAHLYSPEELQTLGRAQLPKKGRMSEPISRGQPCGLNAGVTGVWGQASWP